MAAQTRKKRLDKTEPQTPNIGSTTKFYCCRCGTAYGRQKGFFPVSHSPMYRGSGYLPICGDCVDQMYDQYRKDLGDDRAAMRRMCMKMDLYWNDSIYDMVERTAGVHSRIKNYIGKTNIIRYIDKTFDDTIEDESRLVGAADESDSVTDNAAVDVSSEQEDEIIEIPEDVIEFWGGGFQPGFYLELEKRWRNWCGDIDRETMDISERAIIQQICMQEVIIIRDTALGKPTDKAVNTLNTLLGSANLKPVQRKDEASDATDQTPLGVWIKRWENYRPVPEPDPEFNDENKVVRYISIWMLGHLAKMMGIKNAYSQMYEDEMAKRSVERPEFTGDDEELFESVFDEEGGDMIDES